MLEVAGLRVRVGATVVRSASATGDEDRRAKRSDLVDGAAFRLTPGERLGVIGESGSGKSLMALALMGLLPPGCTAGGSVRLDGTELLGLGERELRRIRGSRMTMVFQDALTALNPLTRVGRQVAEPFRRHRGMSASASKKAAMELLELAGLPDPAATARAHPPQLSGGQRQRVCIAMALACRPRILIADEPTTALDVTVQAEILDLLDRMLALQDAPRPALLFITHDLAVVSRICGRLLVMRAGRIVEEGPTESLLRHPRHEHTRMLLADARAVGGDG